ncbi:RNA 2',3'-cyclic phosphodiesterase [Halorhabdus sp. CUG00001]|uniref:RNA 2',3'-cyclic phosphodiesterase n=1 Tax=Halorhabdus sp. CUG00001 TaxID=2600297 RepID=UPI00131A8702|nr:RNA 2',3'-cyclic phosphodiesterase [Halorhabdus sp. CUG00001]
MSKRLFVSVDLDGLGEAVAPVQEHFEAVSGLNVVDPHQTHVTLKFLGDTDPDQVPELTDELAAAVDESGVEPFETELGGLGAFPSTDYIRVVWLGVREGGEQLTRLHEAIEERTVEMGFDPEEHDFTPHVTLARLNHAGGKELVQNVLQEKDPTVGTLQVQDIRVTESVLTDDGPAYATIESFEL